MSDNSQSRPVEGPSAGLGNASVSCLIWERDRISQVDTFRDLSFAIAGSLIVALLASLLAHAL